MNDDPTEKYRRHLYEALNQLRREYEAAAKPIINELVKIENLHTRPQLVILQKETPPKRGNRESRPGEETTAMDRGSV